MAAEWWDSAVALSDRVVSSGSRSREPSRREFLAAIAAFVAAGRLARPFSEFEDTTLKAAAARVGILFGAAANSRALLGDPAFAAAFAAQAALLVPENELKWDRLEPASGRYDFGTADRMVRWAKDNKLKVRGHALIFHQATPKWAGAFASMASAKKLIQSHVSRVVSHYAGSVYAWDVVNEAVDDSGGVPAGLRRDLWGEVLGAQYLDVAFHSAACADPAALLVYNETRLEYDTPAHAQRRAATLDLLRGMRDRGTPVHALGIQGHLRTSEKRFSADLMTEFIESVRSLGLSVVITELDVQDDLPTPDQSARDESVATVYSQFLGAVLKSPAVKAVSTWGLTDKYTWLQTRAPRPDGSPVRVLPLDRDLHPKAAYTALINAFSSAPPR